MGALDDSLKFHFFYFGVYDNLHDWIVRTIVRCLMEVTAGVRLMTMYSVSPVIVSKRGSCSTTNLLLALGSRSHPLGNGSLSVSSECAVAVWQVLPISRLLLISHCLERTSRWCVIQSAMRIGIQVWPNMKMCHWLAVSLFSSWSVHRCATCMVS